MTNLQVGGLA